MSPLVSVIIPTYNYAHLITETLQSVLGQTYREWECIVIDDGSADDTKAVVQQFLDACRDSRFQYLQTLNEGTSAAKNRGISLAKGKYIQFLDADDLLSPDKLLIQVKHLQQHDSALVFSSSKFFSIAEGRQTEQQKYPEGFLADTTLRDEDLLRRLVINNIITISSPLVKTDLLRAASGFDVTLLNNEDWLLWFRIALQHPVFEFDNDARSYVLIRLHEQSAMTRHRNMFLGEVRVRKAMEELISKAPLSDQLMNAPGDRLTYQFMDKTSLLKLNKDQLALHQVRSLEIGRGMSHIIGSFIRHPFSDYSLLYKGFFKLMVRMYKSVLRS